MDEMTAVSLQPIWIIITPLLTAGLLMFFARIPWLRHLISIAGSLGTLVAVLSIWPKVSDGKVIGFDVPMLLSPLGLSFRIDGLGFMVAAVAAFVWLAATIYAVSYMTQEQNRGRFFFFLALTFAGTIGVPVSGDFLTLLVFFEVMTLASYMLVVHTQKKDAMSAGNLYLYMGVFGGLCLVAGMGFLYHDMNTLVIAPSISALENLTTTHMAAIILLIVGFGIKAGMAPLHIWLPRAHPVAPAPASALLSGVMIKIGAYGIIRTVNMFFTPAGVERVMISQVYDHFAGLWQGLSQVGLVLIWVGIGTMLFGAFTAMLQDNIKRMLACSSISQMGFIVLGVGAGAYLGYEGAMGLAGASYHILNHAFFKSLLFLVAGVIAFKIGELNMYKLGGLWRKMPFTAGAALVGTLGIVGIPLFNGYSSKTLLHHALVEAYEHHQLFSLNVADWLFTLASAGTACYFIKFFYLTFIREPKSQYHAAPGEPFLMKSGITMLAAAIVFIGFFPNYILDRFILPVLNNFMLDPYLIEQHLMGINLYSFKDLGAVALALAIGLTIFALGMRTGIFRTSFPEWLSQEYAGTLAGRVFVVIWCYLTLFVQALVRLFKMILAYLFRGTFGVLQGLDYKPGQSKLYRTINFGNIDFDVALVMILFVFIMIFLFFMQFGFEALAC